MTLKPPNLDDRTFDDLVQAAAERIEASCPEWTDFSAGDPGRTLVEVFAYLTETLIWRVNRLPERAYHEFLGLMGIGVRPPAAASALLTISRADPAEPASLPPGTRVLAERPGGGGDPVTFVTLAGVQFEAGAAAATVRAAHVEAVEGELVGEGDGRPGQSFRVARAPILAPLGDAGDLAVGVELGAAEEPPAGETVRRFGETRFAVWREVLDFSACRAGDRVYVADRATGLILFAPAVRLATPGEADVGPPPLGRRPEALAAAPGKGRRVRVWYRVGGGEVGNVVAGALTRLEPPRAGIAVTNPAAATGGRDGETVANAVARGARDLAARGRAVTASDYEALAESQGHVTRARAYPLAEIWRHAAPGSVEVVLTPFLAADPERGPLTRPILEAACTEDGLERTRRLLAERRPLGARSEARWAAFKPIRIRVRASLRAHVDQEAIAGRLQRALDALISPLPDPATGAAGWPFGQPLRSWHINDLVRREPGIDYLEDPVIETDETPHGVTRTLAADRFQQGFWYAGSGDALYRSVNDGDGWELARRFADETVELVATPAAWHRAPEMVGLVAIVTRSGTGGAFYLSRDCGDSFALQLRFEEDAMVRDLDFVMRDAGPALLFAAQDGLREFVIDRDRLWRQIVVDPAQPDLSLQALAVARNPVAGTSVFVSVIGRGLYCSSRDGIAGSFRGIGPAGFQHALFGVLEAHEFGGRSRVWAGVRAPSDAEGEGCFEFSVTGTEDQPPVRRLLEGWGGESCRGLAFQDDLVLSGTHRGGVQTLSLTDAEPRWRPSDVTCGLPLRRRDALQPVLVIAAANGVVMAGPDRRDDGEGGGVYRSTDGRSFRLCSPRQHRGMVTLPPNWLFCAADHHVIEPPEDER